MGLITYALNVVVIQASIIAFMSPFYLLYRYKRYKNKEVAVNLNTHLEYFLSSRQADYLVFFWAFGEALFWFVIPEFLLLLMVFMRIKKRWNLLVYDIYGTTAGILVATAIHLPRDSLLAMPFVKENMVRQVEVWFGNSGVLALLHQPFSGVPFKVFNHTMDGFHLNIFLYVIMAIIVRIGRYGIFFFLLSGIYSKLHGLVKRNYVTLFFVATTIFAILLYNVYQSFGPGYRIIGG